MTSPSLLTRLTCSIYQAEKLPWMLQLAGFPTYLPLPPLPSPKSFFDDRDFVSAANTSAQQNPQIFASKGEVTIKRELKA